MPFPSYIIPFILMFLFAIWVVRAAYNIRLSIYLHNSEIDYLQKRVADLSEHIDILNYRLNDLESRVE